MNSTGPTQKSQTPRSTKPAKHFPGPWHVNPTGDIGNWIVGTSECPIAAVEMELPTKTWVANARLIAAAPELLEACKFLMSQVRQLADHAFSGEIEEWLEKNDAMNCGKRAIAKAEGRK